MNKAGRQGSFFAGEKIEILHHRDLAAKLGKQNRLLEGGVSAADDGHVLPLVEGSVANGAKGNAVSDEFFFVFDAEQTVLCPRGDYNGLAFKVSAVGDDGLACKITVRAANRVGGEMV